MDQIKKKQPQAPPFNPIHPIVSKVHIVFRKVIRIYMGGLILGVNTLYRFFCFIKAVYYRL